MKQNKTVIILACILVLLTGLYFVVDSGILEPKKEVPKTTVSSENLTVTYFNSPAEHIEITDKNGSLTFDSGDDGWTNKEFEKYPLASASLDDLAAVLCRLTATRELDYTAENVKLFGLDEPSATVKFSNSEGVNKTLLIGNKNAANENYYITIEGSKKLYMISSEYAAMMTSDIMTYVLIPEFTEFAAETVKTVEISKDGITYELTKFNSSNSTHVYLLNYLNALYVSYCHNPYSEELSSFGLEETSTYIKVVYTDESGTEKEFKLNVGDIYSEDDRYYFVTYNDHPNTVYRMFNMNLTRFWELLEM